MTKCFHHHIFSPPDSIHTWRRCSNDPNICLANVHHLPHPSTRPQPNLTYALRSHTKPTDTQRDPSPPLKHIKTTQITLTSRYFFAANRRPDPPRTTTRLHASNHHQHHISAAKRTAASAAPLEPTTTACDAASNIFILQCCTDLVRVGGDVQQLRCAHPHVVARVPVLIEQRRPLD